MSNRTMWKTLRKSTMRIDTVASISDTMRSCLKPSILTPRKHDEVSKLDMYSQFSFQTNLVCHFQLCFRFIVDF